MKYLFVFTLFSCLSFQGISQYSYQDYKNEINVDRKAEICLDLNNLYIRRDLDSLKIVGVELMLDAAETKNRFAEAVAEWMLGDFQIRTGGTESGLENLRKALDYFEKQENYTLSSELYNNIGHALLIIGEYDEAIVAYQTSLKQGAYSTDETALFNGQLGLGRAYLAKNDTVEAMNAMMYYKDEAERLEKFEAVSDAYAYMGMIIFDSGDSELALEYYSKSLNASRTSESLVHLSHAQTNQAIVYFNLGELDSSLYYFNASLKLRERLNNPRTIAEAYFNLGNYYEAIEDKKEAEKYYVTSRSYAKGKKLVTDEYDAVEALYLMYESDGDVDSLQLWKQQMDSLSGVLEEKNGIDEELVLYALSAFPPENNLAKSNESSRGLIIIPIGIILLVLVFYAVKLNPKKSKD